MSDHSASGTIGAVVGLVIVAFTAAFILFGLHDTRAANGPVMVIATPQTS